MMGITNPPTLNYHQNTKILIAVGEEAQVNMIDEVLIQLSVKKSEAKPADDQAEKSRK